MTKHFLDIFKEDLNHDISEIDDFDRRFLAHFGHFRRPPNAIKYNLIDLAQSIQYSSFDSTAVIEANQFLKKFRKEDRVLVIEIAKYTADDTITDKAATSRNLQNFKEVLVRRLRRCGF